MTLFDRLCFSLMVFALLAFAAWPLKAESPRAVAEGVDPNWTLCARYVAEAERLLGVPAHLLSAISKAESGRHNKAQRAVFAWPWTVMAEGRGRYLPSHQAAVEEVRMLKAKGVRNIDVGCMQINLMYHPKAFDNLEQAFEPAYNVAYSAKFLTDLHRELDSWEAAVGRYHSATPKYNLRYRTKIMGIWREEQSTASRDDSEDYHPLRQATRPTRSSGETTSMSTLPYTARPISTQRFAHSSQIQPSAAGPFFAR